MSINVKYEYDIEVTYQDGSKRVYKQNTRENARDQMALSKSYGYQAKIIQRKYELIAQKVIR